MAESEPEYRTALGRGSDCRSAVLGAPKAISQRGYVFGLGSRGAGESGSHMTLRLEEDGFELVVPLSKRTAELAIRFPGRRHRLRAF